MSNKTTLKTQREMHIERINELLFTPIMSGIGIPFYTQKREIQREIDSEMMKIKRIDEEMVYVLCGASLEAHIRED
tara:strand:- start:1281 stop:1508 length:228 start_codon:yes stop_codon:yes gene_type:complete